MASGRVMGVVTAVIVIAAAGSVALAIALPVVPDVTGMSMPSAEAELRTQGLRVGNVGTEAPKAVGIRSGRVSWQGTEPGARVPWVTAVDLRVVAYPVIFELPDLKGFWVGDIRSQLDSEAVPIRVACVDPQFQLDEGIITSTTPPAGPIVRADGVTLTVTTLHGFQVEETQSPVLHKAWDAVHADYLKRYGEMETERCLGCHLHRETCGEKPGCHPVR